ncbi:MAG: sigma-54-dependent Fis family transcriptional regulator [Candidatus Omnitrophica bacterium]|nr:sigma-54-dependent Fis family transcriptional regulator [Candidatus Omnitrophota bacterium]
MAKNGSILVVDNEESMRFFLEEILKKEGYSVVSAGDGIAAIHRVQEAEFDLITMDIRMPGMNGLEALLEIKKIKPEVVVVMITAYGSEKIAIDAIQKGAYDYFTKPFDIDNLRIVIRRAIEKHRLDIENRSLRRELGERYKFDNIIGTSGRMMEVLAIIGKIVDTSVTVLLHGETGTGKELIARAIHYNSPRKDNPFVKMNCVAIPDTLLESELFGHEKGAFTGAVSRKLGKFELANEGTLFLDEIGDMNLLTQAKLLRVLQEKEFERVGGTESVKVDVRIISATNKDMEKAIKTGEFREDLYYRLNVVPVILPPLRDRKDDIPLLFEYFMEKFNKELNKNIKHIAFDAIELLMKYDWPGNVRELENVLQRAIVLEKGDTLTREYLPMAIKARGEDIKLDLDKASFFTNLPHAIKGIVADVEKQIIIKTLNSTNWNRSKAAEHLRISRKSLHNKMTKYGLFEEG